MALFLNIALSHWFTSIIEPEAARELPGRDFSLYFYLLNRLNKEVSGWL